MLTLLESIFQLIRPHWLSVLASVPSRAGPILQVFLRLEVASSAARSYIGAYRVKPAKLPSMKPSSYLLMVVEIGGGDLVMDRRVRIFVCHLVKMIIPASDIVSQNIRV